jgi:hypothetical protein
MARSKRLQFTHHGRRVLVFPLDPDDEAVMLALDGTLYGPFPNRLGAVRAVQTLLDNFGAGRPGARALLPPARISPPASGRPWSGISL